MSRPIHTLDFPKGGLKDLDLKFGEWHLSVKDKFATGDLADLYVCNYASSAPRPAATGRTVWDRLGADDGADASVRAVLKLASDPSDNDLLENEWSILTKLFPPEAKDEKFFRYFPRPLCPVKIGGRHANVLPYLDGYISLEQIIQAYPKGIDFQDVTWMFKRALSGLGYAHHQGVIHGAVLPGHVMVHPVAHGAKIIDWSYALTSGRIKALSGSHVGYYPPEVMGKRGACPETDIYMLANCILAVLGGDVKTQEMPDTVPVSIQKLVKDCLRESPHMRPSNAWDFHDAYSKEVKALVGPPTYREFSLPKALP